jgi:hypothetical protein
VRRAFPDGFCMQYAMPNPGFLPLSLGLLIAGKTIVGSRFWGCLMGLARFSGPYALGRGYKSARLGLFAGILLISSIPFLHFSCSTPFREVAAYPVWLLYFLLWAVRALLSSESGGGFLPPRGDQRRRREAFQRASVPWKLAPRHHSYGSRLILDAHPNLGAELRMGRSRIMMSAPQVEVSSVKSMAIALAGTLTLGAIAVGCGEKKTDGTSESGRTGPYMTKFRIGRAVAPDRTVTIETDSFGQGDPIYVSFEVKNVPPKSVARVVWSDSSNQKLSEEEKPLASDNGAVSFEMKGARDLPIGDYYVQFFYGQPGDPAKWSNLGGHPIRVGAKRAS